MKRLFKYLATHQTAVLSISLSIMFSVSIIAMMESFNNWA